jgi:hypothetical protein
MNDQIHRINSKSHSPGRAPPLVDDPVHPDAARQLPSWTAGSPTAIWVLHPESGHGAGISSRSKEKLALLCAEGWDSDATAMMSVFPPMS